MAKKIAPLHSTTKSNRQMTETKMKGQHMPMMPVKKKPFMGMAPPKKK